MVYFELVKTSHEYMRQVIEIEPTFLAQVAPHYYARAEQVERGKVKVPNAKAKTR